MTRISVLLGGESINRSAVLAASFLCFLLPAGQAGASMLATFQWVDISHSASAVPTGSLSLTLPDSITTQTFTTGTISDAVARSELTGLSYTYSNGLSVGLSDITSFSFTAPVAWATSNSSHGGFGSPGADLITGFTFTGSKVFAGDSRAAIFKISEPAGLVSLVGQASNQLTPFVGAASNDAGYWKLNSLVPVPLPAALPLLLSGLGLCSAAFRRRT